MEKILFVSLGCDKNLVDSEQMIGLLAKNGYEFTDDEAMADIAIVNSCCFIGDAKEESINTIIELGQLKEKARLKALIVCGCLSQRYKSEIEKELPEVDAIVGTTAFDEILKAVEDALTGSRISRINDADRLTYIEGSHQVTTGGHFAYLKISDGCDKSCTYCVIPSVRGKYRSVPMEKLISEARLLADSGVKELILVAQETTVYGVDLYGEKRLPQLITELCHIEGLSWIRLMYAYPEEITDELIEVMKKESKLCHYIDMPIQSGSDDILRRMGRRCGADDLRRIVSRLRREIPDICIRTTMIAGFPGETDEEHRASLSLIKELSFDRLGVFTYSAEEGTPAFEMEGQIKEELKKKRRGELMRLQQDIVLEKNEALVGSILDVLIEGEIVNGAGESVDEERVYVGRTYRDAPEVDGLVFFQSRDALMSGDIVRVKIIQARVYDLMGELVRRDK